MRRRDWFQVMLLTNYLWNGNHISSFQVLVLKKNISTTHQVGIKGFRVLELSVSQDVTLNLCLCCEEQFGSRQIFCGAEKRPVLTTQRQGMWSQQEVSPVSSTLLTPVTLSTFPWDFQVFPSRDGLFKLSLCSTGSTISIFLSKAFSVDVLPHNFEFSGGRNHSSYI